MNVLSHDRVMCFYPTLTAERKSLCGLRGASVASLVELHDQSIEYMEVTSNWEEGCGEACPSLIRESYGMLNVGVAFWGGIRDVSVIVPPKPNHYEYTNYSWSLGQFCDNCFCPW
jgi:hypothetical protein